jgi:hypothetical protein
MTLPAFLFGLFIAILISTGFHLITGGNLGRLIVYFLFGCAGFWLGHLLGESLGWTFIRLGAINLGMSILGCLAFLGVGYWLSLGRQEKDDTHKK